MITLQRNPVLGLAIGNGPANHIVLGLEEEDGSKRGRQYSTQRPVSSPTGAGLQEEMPADEMLNRAKATAMW